MPYTRVWNTAVPTGADAAATIDEIFRFLKVDLQERINTILGVPDATAFADPLIQYHDAGNSGAAIEINWVNGPVQRISLTGNCTITFINPVAGRPYVLVLEQSTGGHSATLTGWNFGDGAFAPNTGAGMKNVVTGLWDGTEYIAGQFATGV